MAYSEFQLRSNLRVPYGIASTPIFELVLLTSSHFACAHCASVRNTEIRTQLNFAVTKSMSHATEDYILPSL